MFMVEEILESESRNDKKYYLIKWMGYEDQTWEPVKNLVNVQRMIEKFEDSKHQKRDQESILPQ